MNQTQVKVTPLDDTIPLSELDRGDVFFHQGKPYVVAHYRTRQGSSSRLTGNAVPMGWSLPDMEYVFIEWHTKVLACDVELTVRRAP